MVACNEYIKMDFELCLYKWHIRNYYWPDRKYGHVDENKHLFIFHIAYI